ncbi:substrate-binding domain-containing protein [Caproiciproducens sp. CPB-2]|uniref:substrate-binding domain-containing protein n=1 Tax=Caproiciproducens sp. CPB-2 TaxID=3030017 RepID=UPI0023D9F132|nr:substrate-binding domain-containing protein [Caproiciproducens sp. CPB-2]MDF1496137.1 substrate-binding domain-containing protein [Caproiciproducens sp. CPB-2]
MTRNKIKVFILILLAFAGSFLILNRDRFFEKKSSDPYEISVIWRSKSTESSTTIKQGIDQAARDFNAEVSFITLSGENNAGEQISLLQREIKNGADAIVIAPVNSTDLKEPIEKAQKGIPVVAMQSTVTTIKDLPTISCDNQKLGSALAEAILKNGGGHGRIAILRNSMDSSNIQQRYLGVLQTLKSSKDNMEYWEIPNDSQEAYDTVKGMLQTSSADTLVALDASALEAAAKAEKDLLKTGSAQVQIYGIGRTNTVVSLLEEKIINSLGVENEYNLGYISIRTAVEKIGNKQAAGQAGINFAIVNHENMYNSDNQRLLFPFVR